LYQNSIKYVVQRTRTKFTEGAFSVAGPSVWNSADLRLETDTASYPFPSAFTQ